MFFGQCRRGEVSGSQADGQFETIKKEYVKVLEDSEEKVKIKIIKIIFIQLISSRFNWQIQFMILSSDT